MQTAGLLTIVGVNGVNVCLQRGVQGVCVQEECVPREGCVSMGCLHVNGVYTHQTQMYTPQDPEVHTPHPYKLRGTLPGGENE